MVSFFNFIKIIKIKNNKKVKGYNIYTIIYILVLYLIVYPYMYGIYMTTVSLCNYCRRKVARDSQTIPLTLPVPCQFFVQNHAMRHGLKAIAILLVAVLINLRYSDALVSRFLTMKTIIVPRGVPVTFDFTAVAGPKGMEWGTVVETFPVTMGKVMMTCIASFPLGCIVEETNDGSEIVISEVTEGLGGSNAGLLKGDRIRAFTAVTLPKKV